MLSSAVIVFREVLEAALIVSILLAATRGMATRTRWISTGVIAGIIGAVIVAFCAGTISNAFEGLGQEILNAGILLTAVAMLAWHNIWMSSHAKELVTHLKSVGSKVNQGQVPLYFLAVASGMAVLREGSEIVLFMYGIAAGGESAADMLAGSGLGLIAGVVVGGLLYSGLLRIPAKMLFSVTSWLILLLAAGLAASAANYLVQAGLLPYGEALWDSSAFLSESSVLGQLLHILIGYEARPTAVQLTFYLSTLVLILIGMKMSSTPKKQSTDLHAQAAQLSRLFKFNIA